MLQYKWLGQLASAETAVFAVGDDDQSIYAFRGANVANMQHFERDFATSGTAVRLIKLEQNYRSQGHILDAANALIRHNQTRLGKNLWTADAKGDPIRAFAAPTDLDEAAFIVDVVEGRGCRRRRARRGRGALPQQRAVAGARARAVQRRGAVPGLRRHALLRARRSEACARLPAADRGARRRRRVPARRQFSAARRRRAHARVAAGRRARPGRIAVAGGVLRRADRQGGRQRGVVRQDDRGDARRDRGTAAAARRSST